MTPEGIAQATTAVESLHANGATNLWAGLLAGMDALRSPGVVSAEHQKTILLLTDGQPNKQPPKGHTQELRDYKESHPEFVFQLNTFGFGYNLDSELLLDLAVEGQGTFAFIPDAAIVGTVFVNSVVNALSTMVQQAILHLTLAGGSEYAGPVVGVNKSAVTDASWGRVVNLGPLHYGQSRDVVIPMTIPAEAHSYLESVLVYTARGGAEHRCSIQASARQTSTEAVAALARGLAIDSGLTAITFATQGQEKNAQETLAEVARRIEELENLSGSSDQLTGLKLDIQGRMTKALQGSDRFKRWGKHYLRALLRAHQLQLCTNFMDPGLQIYGGSLFRRLREEGDRVFLSLPAPKPAQRRASTNIAPRAQGCRGSPGATTTVRRTSTVSTAATARSNSPDMNCYYGGSGGG